MATLKETKDRISSVKSTLKITSAMKLVASAKLRKAQKTIETLRPYEETLSGILASMRRSESSAVVPDADSEDTAVPSTVGKKVAIVAISSNSSLCGGFNANVIKKAKALVAEKKIEGAEVEVYTLGRKVADAFKKSNLTVRDNSQLVGHLVYKDVAELASALADSFNKGELTEVWLVYTHFITTSHLEVMEELYLPFKEMDADAEETAATADIDFIVEPSPEEVLKSLTPQVLMLKFYAATLDSEASEHAARTIAMQTATDNAEDLLSELTLEYNKGRQQKITAEILDLVGGMAAES